jgi:hypothetical protein
MTVKIKTNDIKKGTRFLLRNGWFATMADNMKGDTRIATVEGYETETGSVYAHDIKSALINGEWVQVEHTPKQLNLREKVRSWNPNLW